MDLRLDETRAVILQEGDDLTVTQGMHTRKYRKDPNGEFRLLPVDPPPPPPPTEADLLDVP